MSFNLGDSTGLVHTFKDTDVINGRTYYYAIAAYDSGNPEYSYPSENTKYITVLPSGEIITDKNTGYATPTASALGFDVGNIEVEHTSGNGTGTINYTVVDETQITGHDYLIEFWDTSNDELDNDFDQLIDQNDQSEFMPLTTYYLSLIHI